MIGRAHVITVSDRASAGLLTDESGPALVEMLRTEGLDVSGPEVVPDSMDAISRAIVAAADGGAALVITTGGTGVGPRDVTPQATAAVVAYEVPGLGEVMRRAGAGSTPMAALSRATAGVRGRCLVVNVPGSLSGATQSLRAVIEVLPHAVQLLSGDTAHR